MRTRGVTHLKFVFAPDAGAGPGATLVSSIWPGSGYVDVLGMDGYNWGDSVGGTGDRWRSFEMIFAPLYAKLTALDRTAPVWVTEFGSKEPAKEDDWHYPTSSSPVDSMHSKATWIDDMMRSAAFPRVEALVYFEQHKERDWRLESSPGGPDRHPWVCPTFDVSDLASWWVVGVSRPSNAIAKAFRAGFQRMIHRARPRPLGSSDLVAR